MERTKRNPAPIILLLLYAMYFIVLFQITIFRDSNFGVQSANIIPFVTIGEYIRSILSGNWIMGISNIVGNLIIFLPLGYMTAALFPKMRKLTRIFVLACAFSLTIEIFQYVFACGRADIDDVFLNTLSGIIGYWIFVIATRLLNSKKSKKYAIFTSTLMIAVIFIGFNIFNNYRFLLPSPDNPRSRLAPSETHNASNEPLIIDDTPNAHFETDTVTNSDVNTDSTDVTQSNTDDTAWYLILVNKWNYIPDDYEYDLTELSNGQLVDKRIYPELQEMFDTARNDGVYPVVVSGHRTMETQQRLMDEKIAAYKAEGYSAAEAINKAEAWVAIPGTSEHQLGIAVDINADGINSAGYEVYEWLEKNAYKFGFIRRYPPDKIEITGVINEPWHYRYVGIEAATEMYNQGVCLEEYLNEPPHAASNGVSSQTNTQESRTLLPRR